MLDAVTNGAAAVPRRPTSSRWIVGTSAGAFGAYALAHNLRARGVDVDGLVLDSGLLVERALDMTGQEWLTDPAMTAKHGPYFADPSLWIDRAIAEGFDVPLFDTVQAGDALCRGDGSPRSGCAWLHGGLAAAIAESGTPSIQQVHVYPGRTHVATILPGIAVQDDLREWYADVNDSASS
jgi:acetyl esterase/lipase